MTNRSRERTVTHLQELYSVVVGLALTTAMTNLVNTSLSPPVNTQSIPYFIVFLVTIVPICHGALRHLDESYIEPRKTQQKTGALMADWGLLFIESCGLLALALLIAYPIPFILTLIGLLAFDALWGFAAHLAFTKKDTEISAEVK